MICPKCKEEINYFSVINRKITTGTFNGEYDMESDFPFNQEIRISFNCPECEELITEEEEEAIKLLKEK